MPQQHLFNSSTVFDPGAIKAMTSAYRRLSTALHLHSTDPLTEAVAKRIIEHARRGETDPIRLSALVLKDLRSSHGH